MESIVATFHLDWRLMLAQLVNFAIVAGAVWYFVLRPLTAVMNERTSTIEKSLKDAAEITEQLKQAERQRADALKKARQDAEAVIAQAKAMAEDQRQKTVEATKSEVAKIVTESKRQLAQEKESMMRDIQSQVADLVVLAADKVLEGVVTKPIDRAIAQQALAAVKKTSA